MRTRPEPEVLMALRGFPDAQADLSGPVATTWPGQVTVTWYDWAIRPEVGSFCVVDDSGAFDALVGEILHVVSDKAAVYAYCMGTGDIPTDVALQRRAFLALDVLSVDQLTASLEIIT